MKCLIPILALVILPLLAHSQVNDIPAFSNKAGIGGFYFGRKEFYLNGSYHHIYKTNNELVVPVYYFSNGIAKEITLGASYTWALFKNDMPFNLLIGPEINFNQYWRPKYRIETRPVKYGPFISLGIIPSYKIISRLSVAFEFKIAAGYQWTNHDASFPERGWCFKPMGGIKIFYHFH